MMSKSFIFKMPWNNVNVSKFWTKVQLFKIKIMAPKVREVRHQRKNLIIKSQKIIMRAHPKLPIHSNPHSRRPQHLPCGWSQKDGTYSKRDQNLCGSFKEINNKPGCGLAGKANKRQTMTTKKSSSLNIFLKL